MLLLEQKIKSKLCFQFPHDNYIIPEYHQWVESLLEPGGFLYQLACSFRLGCRISPGGFYFCFQYSVITFFCSSIQDWPTKYTTNYTKQSRVSIHYCLMGLLLSLFMNRNIESISIRFGSGYTTDLCAFVTIQLLLTCTTSMESLILSSYEKL